MGCCGSKVGDDETEAEKQREKEEGMGPPINAPNPFECGGQDFDPIQSFWCGCHSCYAFLVFIAAWLLLIIICQKAMAEGDMNRLYRGFDSFGNVCNVPVAKQLAGAKPILNHKDSPYLYYVYLDPAGYTPIEIPMMGSIDPRPYVMDGTEKQVIKELSFCVGPKNFDYPENVEKAMSKTQLAYPCPNYAQQGRAWYLDTARYKNNDDTFIVPLDKCTNAVKNLADVYRGSMDAGVDWCYKVANTKHFGQFCAPDMYDNDTKKYYCADNETTTSYTVMKAPEDCKKTLITMGTSKSTASDRDQAKYLDSAFAGKQSGLSAILMGMVADCGEAYTVFITAAIGAFVLGILWLIVLRYFAGCIVWTAIIGTVVGTAYVTYLIYTESGMLSNDGNPETNQQGQMYMYLAYVGAALVLLEICMIIFLRHAIMLAIAVVKLATSAMRDMPALSFYPIIPYFFLMFETLFFLYFMALLASSGTLVTEGQMRYFTFDETLQKLMAYHLFVFLWTSNFICDCGSITIGMAAALWYFTPNPMVKNAEENGSVKGYVAPPVRPAYKFREDADGKKLGATQVQPKIGVTRFDDSDFPLIKPDEPQEDPAKKAKYDKAVKARTARMEANEAAVAKATADGTDAPPAFEEDEIEEDYMDEDYYLKTWNDSEKVIQVPCCGIVATAMWFIIRYFVGVTAFGSFIVAVVQFVRCVVMYLQATLEDYKENRIVQCIFCMINYCLYCVEKCMKFITKNSYIQAVIWDLGFCEACISSFRFIFRNMGRMAAMGYVANVLVLLGQAFVVSITTAFCAMQLQGLLVAGTIKSIYLPLFLVLVLSYFIGYTFLSVYQMVMDTLLQCVITDEEITAGVDNADTYMNDSLQQLLDRCKSEQAAAELQNGTKKDAEGKEPKEEGEPQGEE